MQTQGEGLGPPLYVIQKEETGLPVMTPIRPKV